MRGYFRLILDILFSPVVAVGLGVSVIGILLSISDGGPDSWERFVYINKLNFIIMIFIYMLIAFIVGGIIEPKNREIEKMKGIIEEKNRQLAQTHQIVYNRYGEFACFANGVRFEKILKEFVDKNIIVDSAQIYRITKNREHKRIVITLNYEKGYCKANFDINSLLQTRFILNYGVYIKFRREVWRRWRRLQNENLKSWEKAELYNHISKNAKELVDVICERFDKLNNIGIVEENDFSYYRLLSILVLMLLGKDGMIEYENVIGDNKINRYLRRGKRTGVLGAILLEDVFIFTHKGESRKNGRMYVSFYFEEYNVPYVTIFSFTPINLSERTNFDEEVSSLVNDFKNILSGGKSDEKL